MHPDIGNRRQKRTAFLERLYEIVDASVSTFVSGFEVGESIGVDHEETHKIIEYLEEKGLIHIDDHKTGTIRITAAGIDHVETAT